MSESLLEKTESSINYNANVLDRVVAASTEAAPDVLEEACQEILRQNTGERIVEQVEILSRLYQDRTVGDVYQASATVEEYAQFATRTEDCQRIEEIYTINDSYSASNGKINDSLADPNYEKEYYRLRSVQIGLFLGETRNEIRINPANEVKVYKYDDEGVAHLVEDKPAIGGEEQSAEDQPATQIIEDFLYRSLISAVKMQSRTLVERQVANTDALAKLNGLHEALEASMSGILSPDSPEARLRRHQVYIHQA